MATMLDYVSEKTDSLIQGVRQMLQRQADSSNAVQTQPVDKQESLETTRQERATQLVELRQEAYREWMQFKGALGEIPAKSVEQLHVYLAKDLDVLDAKVDEDLKESLAQKYDRLDDVEIIDAYTEGAKTRIVEKYNEEVFYHKFPNASLTIEQADEIALAISEGQKETNPEILRLRLENHKMEKAIQDFSEGRLLPDQAPTDYPSYYARIDRNEEEIVRLQGGSVEELKARRLLVSEVYWLTQKPERILGQQDIVRVDEVGESTDPNRRTLFLTKDGWKQADGFGVLESISAEEVVANYPDIAHGIAEAKRGHEAQQHEAIEVVYNGVWVNEFPFDGSNEYRGVIGKLGTEYYAGIENANDKDVHWTNGKFPDYAGADQRMIEALNEIESRPSDRQIAWESRQIESLADNVSVAQSEAERLIELTSFHKNDQVEIKKLLHARCVGLIESGVSSTEAWTKAAQDFGAGLVPEFNAIVARDLPRNEAIGLLGLDRFSGDNQELLADFLDTMHVSMTRRDGDAIMAWRTAAEEVQQTDFYRDLVVTANGVNEVVSTDQSKGERAVTEPGTVIERLEWYAEQQEHLAFVNPERKIAMDLAEKMAEGMASGNRNIDLSQIYDNAEKAEARHQLAIQNIMPLIAQAEAAGYTIDTGKAHALEESHTEVRAVARGYGRKGGR